MFELLITMLERLGIIVTIAFILTRLRFFRGLIYQERLTGQQVVLAILFFGFFGIIGTYSGIAFSTETQEFNRWASGLTSDEALANSRVIGVVIAGLLGGYRVGIGAGIIAGIHRFTLGGFTAASCGTASILAGVIAGYFHKKNKHMKLSMAFFIGASAEAVQMLVILLLSKPFEKAWDLVEVIGIPMILANGLGSALFLLIIRNVIHEEEKTVALQAQKTLRIADQTLVHLRQGLNRQSAQAVCEILHKEIQTSAVSMTNLTSILSHVGAGDDHHLPNSPIQTQITKDAIRDGKLTIAADGTIHCQVNNCPLSATVIAPLKQRGQTIGTLKFYFESEKEITPFVKELISGLSVLLGNQLELAEADKAFQMAKELEIKTLQAQISPHFLFNSLTTIVSLIRIEPTKARQLLISLSHFLRQNLAATTQEMTTLEQELKHVQAYLEIEETRFVSRLTVHYEIDESALSLHIPPLTLQPIVENAIKHGIKDMEGDCVIRIKIQQLAHETQIEVEDNGKGMDVEQTSRIGKEKIVSEVGNGVALYNVNRRLSMTFGENSELVVHSKLDEGTSVIFSIPRKGEVIDGTANSPDCG